MIPPFAFRKMSPRLMKSDTPQISILQTVRHWWRHAASVEGAPRATRRLAGVLWEFVRDSAPERRRARFGDADYDWDHRVNTTSGAVGWRDRLLGMFHSAYQPTDPAAFREMLNAVQGYIGDLSTFTFIDLGSGKGRTLLMASDYPFRRIVGIELLPNLHRLAQENVSKYRSDSQKCFEVQSVCCDAITFDFPEDALVLYLFNPLPDFALRHVLANLEQSRRSSCNPVYILYHNPLLEHVLGEYSFLQRIASAEQFSLWSNRKPYLEFRRD